MPSGTRLSARGSRAPIWRPRRWPRFDAAAGAAPASGSRSRSASRSPRASAGVLRLAKDEVEGIPELAAGLGADVPSQLDPAFALIAGAGEQVERMPAPAHFGVVLVPSEEG